VLVALVFVSVVILVGWRWFVLGRRIALRWLRCWGCSFAEEFVFYDAERFVEVVFVFHWFFHIDYSYVVEV
jgi:hypothetical protein